MATPARRGWKRALAALVVVAAVLAAALVWLAQSETALRWATALVDDLTGGAVRIEGVHGSLLGPIRAARVAYADADLRVTATDVALDASLPGLLKKRLVGSLLSAGEIVIELLPAQAPSTGPPESIALPVTIALDRVTAGRIVIDDAGERLELRALEARYAGGPDGHRAEVARVVLPWGTASGVLTLAGARPFATAGEVRLVRDEAPWTADVTAKLSGSLVALEAALAGTARGLPVAGTASLAPFDTKTLTRGELSVRALDLGALVPDAPRTDATVKIVAQSADRGYAGTVEIANAAPGPITDERLPLVAATSRFAYDGAALALDDLAADLGGRARVSGSGRIGADGASEWRLRVAALDLRAVHRPLRATRLDGRVDATLDGDAQQVEVDLREQGIALAGTAVRKGDRVTLPKLRVAAGRSEVTGSGEATLSGAQPFSARATLARLDPADFGDWPSATLNGTVEARGTLAPQWRAEVTLALADSRWRGLPLAASGKGTVLERGVRDADLTAQLGANRAHATGGFGTATDRLTIDFDARNLAQLDARLGGRAAGQAVVTGTIERPAAALTARGEQLRFGDVGAAALEAKASVGAESDRSIALDATARGVAAGGTKLATARASATGRVSAHVLELTATGADIDADLRFEGGFQLPPRAKGSAASDVPQRWSGVVARLENRGAYPVRLLASAPLDLAPERFALGAAALRVFDGELNLRRAQWDQGRLSTAGSARALPVATFMTLAGVKPEPGTDLRLRGEWSLDTTPRLNGTLRLERESGDMAIASNPTLALGLERLAVDARFVDDVASVAATVAAARVGTAALAATIAPPAGAAPGTFGAASRIDGTAKAQLVSLALVDQLLGTAAIVGGRGALDLTVGGTLGKPALTGTVTADALRVDVPTYGIALRDGTLRARLEGDTLALDALSIRGPEGVLTATGTLARGMEGARLAWKAERLRIFNRPDRRLMVTGEGTVAVTDSQLRVRGTLRADEGYIEYAGPERPWLGEDVVVVGRSEAKPAARTAGAGRLPLDLDVTLDPGTRLRIVGVGLDAYLRGSIRVRTQRDGDIVARGTIETVNGTYRTFGQKLDIDRGRLIFDGPITNPALDVLALRKGQAVEAGVEVTGTARAPRVRLTSNPPVPDAEKLSWLVLGRGVTDASGADLALLQAAASTLISGDEPMPAYRRLIEGVGLDDVSVRSASGATSAGGTASGQVVAFGKRISDRLYLEYEQGITVVTNLIRLNFALTRTLSVNATTSQTTSSFGFNYRRAFD